jgi:hypothetical protein
MDPITAIGLVSGILTFLDIGHQIVKGACEIRKSGTGVKDENAHIGTIITALRDASDQLDAEQFGKTKSERVLKRLVERCEALSEDLLQLLDELKVTGRHSTWKTLKASIKSMRKEGKINELKEHLDDFRSQLILQLGVIMKYVAARRSY